MVGKDSNTDVRWRKARRRFLLSGPLGGLYVIVCITTAGLVIGRPDLAIVVSVLFIAFLAISLRVAYVNVRRRYIDEPKPDLRKLG